MVCLGLQAIFMSVATCMGVSLRLDHPTLFFIYLFRGRLPPFLAQLRRFVQTGQVPRGLHRDVAPSRRVLAGGGLRVCSPPSPPLPSSPLAW